MAVTPSIIPYPGECFIRKPWPDWRTHEPWGQMDPPRREPTAEDREREQRIEDWFEVTSRDA